MLASWKAGQDAITRTSRPGAVCTQRERTRRLIPRSLRELDVLLGGPKSRTAPAHSLRASSLPGLTFRRR